MLATQISALAFLLALTSATLDPALSNSRGRCPKTYNCDPAKTSHAIQAAECAHNTRTSTTQTFAVFETDHQYDSSHGAPYGTCYAYTCAPPDTPREMENRKDCWTFFWERGYGRDEGVGTGCIRSPEDAKCGCEMSDGTFVPGGTSCR